MENFEESRVQDISHREVLDSLYVFFSDIKEKDIKFLYHGTYNVFEIKKKYIFRFPDKFFRNALGINLILNEVKMVNFIRNYVSLSIPEPIFISIEKDNPFIGNEKIDGISLSKCFYEIPPNKKMRIAKQIGEFLSQLHSIELYEDIIKEKIIEQPFSLVKYREAWQIYFENLQGLTFPILSKKQQNWINQLFTKFLDNKANFNFQPCVVHGDFDTSNILIDPKIYDVTGIIDFEESRIYDPAVDFTFYDEGKSFINQILSNFKGKKESNFEERMRFLYGRSCLPYIEFGLNHDLHDMINAGIKRLNRIMTKFET